MQTHIKTSHATAGAKVLDSAAGICEYIASDETLDRDLEIITATAWLPLATQPKSIPFLNSHRYTVEDIFGKVLALRVEDKSLIATVQWNTSADAPRLAQIGWGLAKTGFLPAVSVGFEILASTQRGDPNFHATLKSVGQTPNSPCWRIITQARIAELSACAIGANPNALAKAIENKAITHEEIQFLAERCAAPTSPKAHGRAGGEVSQRASQSRTQWLCQFHAATTPLIP